MKPEVFCLFVVVLWSGCVTASFSPDEVREALKTETAKRVECPRESIRVSWIGEWIETGGVWSARACGRDYRCRVANATVIGGTAYSRQECAETEGSKERTTRSVVLERLEFESGCSRQHLRVEAESDWSVGGQRSYRLKGCGRYWVCTSAPGKVDCKTAEPPASAPTSAPK
jgi:hypothetical protein